MPLFARLHCRVRIVLIGFLLSWSSEPAEAGKRHTTATHSFSSIGQNGEFAGGWPWQITENEKHGVMERDEALTI